MNIVIPEKFSEKQIDEFIHNIYINYSEYPEDDYSFDFSKTEWISNQSLVLLAGLLKYFNTKKIKFSLNLFGGKTDLKSIDKRNAIQILSLWDTYEIQKVIPQEQRFDFIEFYESRIEFLKKFHNIKSLKPQAYEKYDITPITTLNRIKHYKDKDVEELLEQYYVLNLATQEILNINRCEHPFVNKIIGSIISKELYENFLDHFESNFFQSKVNYAFMSLTLKGKLDEEKYIEKFIQEKLQENFEKESLPESKGFFYDNKLKKFINNAYIQYTFLDFGKGIVDTLKNQYQEKHKLSSFTKEKENDVLKFAFMHSTSRFPIYDKYGIEDIYIPRGLFDVLCMIKRYEGLLVVRSNYGKILYDFSKNKSIEEAYSNFGDNNSFFPGTMISIYLPAAPKGNIIDHSVIKPFITLPDYTAPEKKYINLYEIINKLNSTGKNLYTELIKELYELVNNKNQNTLIYFSFYGCNIDIGLTKKLIYFLLTNYDFNIYNNIIVVHPPDERILEEINNELLNLSSVIKNFKIHPLPFIYYSQDQKNSIRLQWLGVFNEGDKNTLNDLLYGEFSLAKSDFIDPPGVTGHINYFDEYGNLKSNLPNAQQLIHYYEKEFLLSDTNSVSNLIEKNHCLIKNKNEIFLCNGDYYQYEFLSLINLLENKEECELVTQILFDKLQWKLNKNEKYKYIGVSTTSHKILDALVSLMIIEKKECIYLDNFFTSVNDEKLNEINENSKFVLICDVLATGAKATELFDKIKEKKGEVEYIGVIASTIDPSFEDSGSFIKKHNDKIICLYQHEIKKYRRNDSIIKEDLQKREIARINPFTNIPITFTITKTNLDGIIFQKNDDFLNLIDEKHIDIGFQIFNNVIHPYFFDTDDIIKYNGEKILIEIFKNINDLDTKNLKIFFPKNSGIQYIKIETLKNKIFHDHSIEVIELERFSTSEGWKFPHTTDYLSEKVNKNNVLILDDGSCSGDSLIQMINQISLFDPNNIIVLCIIGRVDDHKREFLSLISTVKNNIKVKIYFGTHWHIPIYYLDNNPNSSERKWLSNIIELQNIPYRIKRIAEAVLREIEPKKASNFNEYKYLPSSKEDNKKIPKKDLIKIRDEIGKVTGYRYYKESFTYFDEFIKKYEAKINTADRYKDIELLCAAITYEPYLFEKLKLILPDIVAKIKEFIDVIIFQKSLKIEKLFYKWDKKDLVHMFFIVYNEPKILEVLSSPEKLNSIINFIDNTVYSLDYFLYRLLIFFPLDIKELKTKNSSRFQHSIDVIIQNNLLHYKALNEIKIFHSFISSLPTKKDYYSLLSEIVIYYKNITDKEHHKKLSLVSQIDLMLMDIVKMKKSLDENKDNFIKSWELLSAFIVTFLSFTKSYPGFYLDKIVDIEGKRDPDFFSEGKDDINLRFIHGELNDMVYNLSANSNFDKVEHYLKTIKNNFLQSGSDFYKIFNNITTFDPGEIINQLLANNKLIEEIEFQSKLDCKPTLDFPLYYFKDILFTELISNLRHRDYEEKIKIMFFIENQFFYVKIQNKISDETKAGGRSGMILLNKLNDFPFDIAKYFKELKSKNFTQLLRFKRL